MSEPVDTLDTDREARRSALARLTGHVERFRAKPVSQRVSDDLGRKAQGLAKEAVEVAADSKPVIAGTLGALALWFLRKPLLGMAQKTLPKLKARFSKDEDA